MMFSVMFKKRGFGADSDYLGAQIGKDGDDSDVVVTSPITIRVVEWLNPATMPMASGR